ncbi:unnamed protein product [Cochlearia groenlandica]
MLSLVAEVLRGMNKGTTKVPGQRAYLSQRKCTTRHASHNVTFVGKYKECPEMRNKKGVDSSINLASESRQPLYLKDNIQDSTYDLVMDLECSFHITPNKEVMFTT